MKIRQGVLSVVMLGICSLAGASGPETQMMVLKGEATAAGDCATGTKLDDGSFETAFRIPFASSAQFVQRLVPSSYPAVLRKSCSCWATDDAVPSVGYSVVVYDDDGPNGQPGTRLGTLSSTATGLNFAGKFNEADCTPLDIRIDSGAVYVGVDWNAAGTPGVFVCADLSLSTPLATMYQSSSGGATWTAVNPSARALGLRAEFEAPSSSCVPSSNRLCLNQGRFAVTAKFQAGTNPEGTASVVKLTDETGYLWFFNSNNVEAVVKVLNGCGLTGSYWVFAGGLTNVQVDLTVTDTQTGNSKTYRNPQGTAFQPIQDTAALPCN